MNLKNISSKILAWVCALQLFQMAFRCLEMRECAIFSLLLTKEAEDGAHNTQPTRPKNCVLDVFAWQSQHHYKEFCLCCGMVYAIFHMTSNLSFTRMNPFAKKWNYKIIFLEIEVILEGFQSPKVRGEKK